VRPHRAWLASTAGIALVIYAALWLGYVQQWAWMSATDSAALDPLHRIGEANPGWVAAWDVFCTVFSPIVFRIVVLVWVVVLVVRRNLRIALFLTVSVLCSGLVTEIAKNLVDRPRPAGALVSAHSTSFPSGHALGVLVSVAALLAVAWPMVGEARRRWLLVLGVAIVVAIGGGRVVLNVHHPSDVLAGWALGYAYFVVCLLAVSAYPSITEADETPAVPDTSR
jgi:undecaprenyl-diphosphatase